MVACACEANLVILPHLVTNIKQTTPKMSLPFTVLLLLLFPILSPYLISLAHSKVARLGITPIVRPNKKVDTSADSGPKTLYFNQKLDHFTYTPKSYTTFQQRYVIDSKHWAGAKANAPILAFLGEESSLEADLGGVGFFHDNGPRLKALLVYIEHRYYGKSMPFGSEKEALKNTSTLGYLNAAQALADYAAILLHIKETYSAKHSPLIVVGASYGGVLAAWFRLKYPHIALGALASSSPLLYLQDTPRKHGYYYVVTKVFKETSERCYKRIRKSWDEIDRVAAKPNGLLILSKKFKACAPLNRSFVLKDYLDSIYSSAVQYNKDPDDWVTTLCNAINNNPPNHKSDLLDRIFAGLVAFMGKQSCYDIDLFEPPTDGHSAWEWQCCTELVIPVGHDKEATMFQTAPFNMTSYVDDCKSVYGVSPQQHWITTYFGTQGDDIKLLLRRFGSNIIFSNGLSDPYSGGGVLEDVSDTVLAITTVNGTHCQDLSSKRKEDPEWLVLQREKEIKIIESWISTYQNDLRDLNISF